jgi:hypothetical protein
MKLTEAEKAGLTPGEIAALESTDADAALATLGDEVPAEAQASSADDDEATDDGAAAELEQADAAADGQDQPAGDEALTPEQLAAVANDAPGSNSAKLPTFEVPERDFGAEKKALKDSRAAIQQKWDEGEITDEQLRAQLDEVDDKLEALATERARAETLRAINEQAAREAAARQQAEEQAATEAVIKAAAASTTARVDYVKDVKAQRQFDMAWDMLKADPDNATMTAKQLAQAAHRHVLAIRGLPMSDAPATNQATNTTPARQPAARQPRDVPVTLSGLPNASPVQVQDEMLAQITTLDGLSTEEYMARLSPAQLDKLMRTVDGRTGPRH